MPDLKLDINAYREQQHLREQETMVQAIRRYYDEVINQIAPIIASGASRVAINRKLDKILKDMVQKTAARVQKGMQTSWMIAEKRTAELVEQKYKGMELPPEVEAAVKSHRRDALNKFINRREKGLNLSDRVWKTADQYKDLINQKLDEGIQEGRSAVKIAKELRQALQDPSPSQESGQGVYKSPVKNTERVARTEVNMANRMADQEAWQNNPLVLGYTINLSATGKPKVRCELCRLLAGDYPVTFIWKGWHPHCLCFKTPILMSRAMLDAYNKLIARGEDTPEAIAKLQKGARVEQPPSALKDWILKNLDRVKGWKSKPYWWEDNEEWVSGLFK